MLHLDLDTLYFLGRHILREHCSSHTGNLAIHDMFMEGDSKCTKNIELKIGWNKLLQMLQIMWNFVCETEKDLASIADIVQPFLNTIQELYRIQTQSAIRLAEHLQYRFIKNCPLQLPFFAYLLTQNGLLYFLYDIKGIENFNNFQTTMNQYMNERRFNLNDIMLIHSSFNSCLVNFDILEFSYFNRPIDMWKCQEYLLNKYGIPYCFSKLSVEILSIPASEAAVERVFSSLSKIATKEMSKIQTITLNSRFIIKNDSIFGNPGVVELEDLSNDPDNILKLSKYSKT